MLESFSLPTRAIDRLWAPLCDFVYRRLKISPNQISVLSFILGVPSVVLIGLNEIEWGMFFMFLSQFFDGLDGSMARRFSLVTPFGRRFEVFSDRTIEFLMFFALAYAGKVTYLETAFAVTAILLVTSLVNRSGFDPGFKRISLYVGYVIGFSIAVQLVFIINLAGFVISLLMVDYKVQQETDRNAIEARNRDPNLR